MSNEMSGNFDEKKVVDFCTNIVYNIDMKKKLRRMDLYVPETDFEKLEKLSEKTYEPISAHVRKAIQKYLKGKELE